jgi:hypothetical protein
VSRARVRLSSQTRGALVVFALTAVAILVWLAWFWLVTRAWAPPRLR